MAKITIQRGDSARIQIILPVDKMADVEDVICYVGASLVFKQSDDTLIATTDPNIFYIDLKSKVTNTLAGENELAIAVDYSDLGVKKTPKSENLIIVVENNVNVFSNPSVSDLILATVNVTINETTISSDSCIASYVVVNSGGGGGIPDAPNDANAYVRSGLSWVIGYTKTAIDNLLGNKVEKVTGKSLIDDTEISRLASMTAIFTTALKTAYDSAVTWISTNGANLLSHLNNTSNPHNVTKNQVGLSNVANSDTTTTENITDSSNKRFVTDAEKTAIAHSNRSVLDDTTESFTTALKNIYDIVVPISIDFHSDGGQNLAMSNSPLAERILLTQPIRHVKFVPLDTRYTKVRLIASVATVGTAESKLALKYKTGDYSAVIADFSNIGTSEVSISMANVGRVDTGWINLVEPAKAEVQITIIESGGDGVADPQIGYLTAFFK
mgnify:CR=1 FL=1